MTLSGPERSLSECSADMKVDDHEEKVVADIKEEEISDHEEGSKTESFKQKMLVDQQQKDIQVNCCCIIFAATNFVNIP